MQNNHLKMPVITVVAGVLINEKNEVLLVKRPSSKAMGGLFEFPGGKIEPHETPESALERELLEEINLKPLRFEPMVFISHAYSDFHLILLPFKVTQFEGILQLKEGQEEYIWIHPKMAHLYSVPSADAPIFEALCL